MRGTFFIYWILYFVAKMKSYLLSVKGEKCQKIRIMLYIQKVLWACQRKLSSSIQVWGVQDQKQAK